MNTSKSLKDILYQLKVGISLSSKAPYPVFDDTVVGHAFEQAEQAIVEAVEGIYGDSDGLREFASTDSNQVVTPSVNKRWRAVPFKRSTYWIITDRLTVSKTTDKNRGVDSQRYKAGNYFQTQEQAIAASKVLKGVLTVNDLVATDKEARNG